MSEFGNAYVEGFKDVLMSPPLTRRMADRRYVLAGNQNNRFVLWASEFIPRSTNGCGVNSLETGTNRVNYDTLDFDAAAIEYAQRWVGMPSNWNLGTITAKFWWTAASGSGDVIWGIQARTFGDNSALDQASGTAQTATDTLQTAAANHISPSTVAITVAGTLDAGSPILFQVYRNATAGGDTLAVDAQLIAVEITFTPA